MLMSGGRQATTGVEACRLVISKSLNMTEAQIALAIEKKELIEVKYDAKKI